jgi:hypothetical protein
MNESDLENELRKLRPAIPSRELEDAIAHELAENRGLGAPRDAWPHAGSVRTPWLTLWLDRLLWSGLGAAAVLVIMLAFQSPTVAPEKHVVSRDVPTPQDANLQPVLASEEDLGWRDEGVRFDANGRPILKLTRTSVERQAWADLQNAGVVQVEQPRQEVMWVPVTLH